MHDGNRIMLEKLGGCFTWDRSSDKCLCVWIYSKKWDELRRPPTPVADGSVSCQLCCLMLASLGCNCSSPAPAFSVPHMLLLL